MIKIGSQTLKLYRETSLLDFRFNLASHIFTSRNSAVESLSEISQRSHYFNGKSFIYSFEEEGELYEGLCTVTNLKRVSKDEVQERCPFWGKPKNCCQLRQIYRREEDRVALVCPDCTEDAIVNVYKIESGEGCNAKLAAEQSLKIERVEWGGKWFVPRKAQLVEERFVYIGFAEMFESKKILQPYTNATPLPTPSTIPSPDFNEFYRVFDLKTCSF